MSQDKFVLRLPMEGYAQPNSKTCWYACYAMMYAWKNKSVDELDQRLSALGYDLSEIKNRGLREYEYGKVAHALGLHDVHGNSARAWSLEDVYDRLQRWGPIFLMSVDPGGNGKDGKDGVIYGHARVLYGVDIRMGNLILADPYSIGGDYGSAHKEYFNLERFQTTIMPINFTIQVF